MAISLAYSMFIVQAFAFLLFLCCHSLLIPNHLLRSLNFYDFECRNNLRGCTCMLISVVTLSCIQNFSRLFVDRRWTDMNFECLDTDVEVIPKTHQTICSSRPVGYLCSSPVIF